MRASSQRKQAVETGLNPDVSRPRAVEPDESAIANRRGTLRPVRSRLIIRDPQVDGEAEAPIGNRNPIRRQTSSRADVWSLPAMLDHEASVDRSLAPTDRTTSITELLGDLRSGRREAFDQILPLVYQELRRAARRELAVRPSDSMSTTALVHELYLKFSRAERNDWRNRAHFLGVASVAMRHILVDRARRRKAEKRGGPHRHVTLDDDLIAADSQAESLLELHEALDQLAKLDERLARVVECRFFGGMTEQETAEALHIAVRTVRRDWIKARGLLYQALGTGTPRDPVPRNV
jgi:RNA polymerase sigma factor (TIGR02999 family)